MRTDVTVVCFLCLHRIIRDRLEKPDCAADIGLSICSFACCCSYFKKSAFASLLHTGSGDLCCPVEDCAQNFLNYPELFFHLFVYSDRKDAKHSYSVEHRYVLSNLAWQFACKCARTCR